MHPQYPWAKPTSAEVEKVGLISIGSLEEKIPFILHPLLLSSDVVFGLYKNYDYPQELSIELLNEINALLQTKNVNNIVFDLRIHNWTNTPHLKHSRILSHTLQDICNELKIHTSIILTNGNQLIGNALGILSEMMEVSKILKGEGPPDLTKYALEIGADFLMMTKKADQRIEAKKWLREKILGGDLSPYSRDFSEKWKFSSLTEGYVHHLVMDKLHALKLELADTHPGICLFLKKKAGDWVEKGEDMIEFYPPKGQKNPIKQETCQKVFIISVDPPNHQPLILERMGLNLHS